MNFIAAERPCFIWKKLLQNNRITGWYPIKPDRDRFISGKIPNVPAKTGTAGMAQDFSIVLANE
jgi:hypothetical protein